MNQRGQSRSPIDAQLAAPPVTLDESPTQHNAVASDSASQTRGGLSDLVQNKWLVLAVLFTVTGAIGLPLLWVNRKFSTLERFFWSIVVTLYTIILIAIVIAILTWSYRQIMG